MSEYTATVSWRRQGAVFTDQKYSRAHQWRFDGGAVVPGSSSPHVVRVPLSDPAAVDPEEAFVASLSSCHMLFFLSLAAGKGLVVDSYEDAAVGVMAKKRRRQARDDARHLASQGGVCRTRADAAGAGGPAPSVA